MEQITSLNDLKIQIKNTVDLRDYLENDGIRLKRSSGQNWVGLCPFHNEKTPSFTVNESYQNYHCFGCGKHGDIFSYIQETEAVSWKDSVIYLAKEYNISYKLNNDSKKYEKYSRAYALVEELKKFYIQEFNRLTDNHPAKKMITERKLDYTSAEYGYAPASSADTINYMVSKGFTKEEMIELGLAYESGYTQQTNRLIFFINNYMGKTVGFTGRALAQKDIETRKYVNSSDSIIFHKKNVVFNIDKAKKSASQKKEIYLVEGQFDVAAMSAHGYENVVAISGTAFTNEQLKEITRAVGPDGNIILLLDDDSAGRKAAHKIFSEHSSIHNNLFQITLKEGEDPCDYLQHTESLPEKESYIEKTYNLIKSKYTFNNIQSKTEFIAEIQTHITQYIKNPILKEQYLRRACSYVGFSYDKIQVISNSKADKDTLVEKIEQTQDSTSKKDYLIYYIRALNILFTYSDYFKKHPTEMNIDKLSLPMKKIAADFFKGRIKTIMPDYYEEKSPEWTICQLLIKLPAQELDEREIYSQYIAFLNHAERLKKAEERERKNRFVLENISSAKNNDTILEVLKELN